jgi:hypothetical protein
MNAQHLYKQEDCACVECEKRWGTLPTIDVTSDEKRSETTFHLMK